MRARDSGMPEEQMWASFFDAPHTLALLGFSRTTENIGDFGFELLAPFISLPPYHYGIVGRKPNQC